MSLEASRSGLWFLALYCVGPVYGLLCSGGLGQASRQPLPCLRSLSGQSTCSNLAVDVGLASDKSILLVPCDYNGARQALTAE